MVDRGPAERAVSGLGVMPLPRPLAVPPSRVVVSDLCARLDWPQLFGNAHPVTLDLGAGDGRFALGYAAQHPEMNLLAVERLLGRVRKIEKRAARAKLENLRVLRLELGYTVRYLLPAASISIAYILFPDPWPKRRHWPRRLLQADFIRHLAPALRPGGELRFATDHADYYEAAAAEIDQTGLLARAPLWDFAHDPLTDFQAAFEDEGRATFRARWIKPAAIEAA